MLQGFLKLCRPLYSGHFDFYRLNFYNVWLDFYNDRLDFYYVWLDFYNDRLDFYNVILAVLKNRRVSVSRPFPVQ